MQGPGQVSLSINFGDCERPCFKEGMEVSPSSDLFKPTEGCPLVVGPSQILLFL